MAAVDDAIYENIVFLDYFSDLPDPRQAIKVIYPLDEVLLLSLVLWKPRCPSSALRVIETLEAAQRSFLLIIY